jgi:YgiT-type zinc finger domain-containing protein
MTCAFCKGELEERLIRYVSEFEGRVVVVENVPALVCRQCGEKFIRPEVVENIQRVVWERPSPKRSAEVPCVRSSWRTIVLREATRDGSRVSGGDCS